MKMKDYDYDKPFTFRLFMFCISVLISAISMISALVFFVFDIWDIIISEIEYFNLRMVATSVISFGIFFVVSILTEEEDNEDDENDE